MEVREVQDPGADPDFGQEDLRSKLSSHQPPQWPQGNSAPHLLQLPIIKRGHTLHAHAHTTHKFKMASRGLPPRTATRSGNGPRCHRQLLPIPGSLSRLDARHECPAKCC